uniref:NADPH oxidase organizer 1 n=1 Tax=Junco hyemalis TaxID=40217 RepID=A0A8C5INC3_JUNHY
MLIVRKHPKLNIVIKLLLFPQNYMMFVSWSDQNNILIYRTFEDFRKFHVSEFPIPEISREKMLLQGPRSIAVLSQLCPCYFEGITMQQRKGGKLNRCLEILKLLETYSQELLKTDVKISRGEEVNQFFKAQTQDLDPSFPENSAVIMPSVFRREKSPQPLSITLPQASQSYRCIKAFETKDTKNKPFTVAQEEIVEVLIKDMTGWWLVENADKQIAWFPASYLEDWAGLSQGSEDFLHKAYEAQKADELSLNQGVVVEVLRMFHNGWWLISAGNARLAWKPELSRSLPEVEPARSSPGPSNELGTHSSKSPELSARDRNDSGFVESCTAEPPLADPELAAGVPKVPARPSAHEILQRCSTVTKRAVQHSAPRPALPDPSQR